MKMYCALLINEITGDIDHCVTSDFPVTEKMIPVPSHEESKVKTIPKTPKLTFRKCFCEFDSESFCRGKEVLKSLKMSGNVSTGNILIVKGKKLYNLKETNETTMKNEYDKREKEATNKRILELLNHNMENNNG